MNEFINWSTLQFSKSTGKEKIRCPKCDASRSDKKDRSLQISHKDGFGKCHYCEALTFREDNTFEKKVEYKLPVQNWKNYTKLSDGLVKWLEEERKIPQHVAIELGFTEEKYYQPKKGKEVNNLVFNFFEGETVVNKKYRDSEKNFTQSQSGKPLFFNINSAIDQEEVYIVEGEMDVASLYAVGVKNVISPPAGANDNDNYWINSENYLKKIKHFIIAVDTDQKGKDIKEAFSHRLGKHKCSFIDWTYKDANDSLKVSKNALRDDLKKIKRFPVSGTFTSKDLRDGVNNLYDNGLPKTIYPKSDCFGELKNIFSLMRGQVVLPTGIPSHGKSTFTDWYVLNLINDYNMKASWYSPEHTPMDLYETEIIQKVIGKNFWKDKDGIPRVTKKEIDQYDEWSKDKIYFTDCGEDETPTWKWLLDKFKEQMYSFGINIFVIDAFNKVVLPKGNKLDEINAVLTKLTHFAKANDVIIFLVAHPTKMIKNRDTGAYDMPTLYDVSGSSDFRNQVHNGFCIYRHFGENERTTFVNLKTKFSFQGKIGETEDFIFCPVNGRLVSPNCENPYFNLIKPELKVKNIQLTPEESFDI